MSQASDMVRTEFKKGDDIRDAGLTTPEDIIRYDDIVYGEDPKWQSLDVYRPKSAEGKKLPVIVSVHGGGWVYGDKERYQFYCMNLAQRGFAVVNYTYRLAPEYKYPSSLEDTNSVFTWILAHGGEYGFDTAHIFGVGDSAGGHNLGLYAGICTNPQYAAGYGFKTPEGFAPTAIGLHCGAYRIEIGQEGNTDDLTQRLMADFLPEKGTEKELELIDVTKHITEKYPLKEITHFIIAQLSILRLDVTMKNVSQRLLPTAIHAVHKRHILLRQLLCQKRRLVLQEISRTGHEKCGRIFLCNMLRHIDFIVTSSRRMLSCAMMKCVISLRGIYNR